MFDDLLVTAATWLLAGAAAWAVLICLAAALETVTSGRLRATTWVGCPPSVRRVVLAGLGATLAASPVHAAAPTAPSPRNLPPPARPLGGPAGDRIVVRPGDALWRLAERRLPDRQPAARVAALVERLHERNRAVIGPDPDLIRPGQHLVVPHHHEENP